MLSQIRLLFGILRNYAFGIKHRICAMPQAKIVSEQELKRAMAVIAARRFAERDRLALLMTHWAGI